MTAHGQWHFRDIPNHDNEGCRPGMTASMIAGKMSSPALVFPERTRAERATGAPRAKAVQCGQRGRGVARRGATSGRIAHYQRHDSGLAIDSKGRRSAATPQIPATVPAPTMRAAPIR